MQLSFERVSKSYGAVEALREVSLTVAGGSILALLGPNGAGKSTLFGCLLGTVLPDSGQVRLGGRPVTHRTRMSFGYLAERVSLYPQRSVRENAEYLCRLKGMEFEAARAAFDRVGLDRLLERKAAQLSKGQLQRAGLALALAGAPELLVLDEPFNGLDPAVLETVLELLCQERERGATILVSTHTISAAEEIATHAAILLDGKLSLSGSLEELRCQFPRRALEAIYRSVAKARGEREPEALAA